MGKPKAVKEPPIKVRLIFEPDPQRTAAWLKALLKEARQHQADNTTAK